MRCRLCAVSSVDLHVRSSRCAGASDCRLRCILLACSASRRCRSTVSPSPTTPDRPQAPIRTNSCSGLRSRWNTRLRNGDSGHAVARAIDDEKGRLVRSCLLEQPGGAKVRVGKYLLRAYLTEQVAGGQHPEDTNLANNQYPWGAAAIYAGRVRGASPSGGDPLRGAVVPTKL
jgi:hypothetical protein